jgi:translation initiation factor 2 alpha subunit (eIF-2alpha)
MAGTKLSKAETDARVDKCMELRYNLENPMLHREWLTFCKKEYNDKSEKQYTAYWMTAKERYNEGWKAKLNGMLDPAMNSLIELMASDDEKVRQRAIDQIVKYTGNDIEKIEAKIEGNIELNWGEQETGYGRTL